MSFASWSWCDNPKGHPYINKLFGGLEIGSGEAPASEVSRKARHPRHVGSTATPPKATCLTSPVCTKDWRAVPAVPPPERSAEARKQPDVPKGAKRQQPLTAVSASATPKNSCRSRRRKWHSGGDLDEAPINRRRKSISAPFKNSSDVESISTVTPPFLDSQIVVARASSQGEILLESRQPPPVTARPASTACLRRR